VHAEPSRARSSSADLPCMREEKVPLLAMVQRELRDRTAFEPQKLHPLLFAQAVPGSDDSHYQHHRREGEQKRDDAVSRREPEHYGHETRFSHLSSEILKGLCSTVQLAVGAAFGCEPAVAVEWMHASVVPRRAWLPGVRGS
jgi:hypothetical protein